MRNKKIMLVIFLISIFFVMPNITKADTLTCIYSPYDSNTSNRSLKIVYTSSSSYKVYYMNTYNASLLTHDSGWTEVGDTLDEGWSKALLLHREGTSVLKTDASNSSCPEYVYETTLTNTKSNIVTYYYYFYDEYPSKHKNSILKLQDIGEITASDSDTDGSVDLEELDCDSLLGSPLDEGTPAYYLTYAFKVIRYAAIALLVVLSSFDFLGPIASQDHDAIKKAAKKAAIRLAICVVIWLLPYLIEMILQLIHSAYTDFPECGIGIGY